MNYISEAEVQERVANNPIVRNGIINTLSLDNSSDFIREDVYINGITADFTVINDNKISAIIECKAGNINVTDYVRGIGQLYQYEYFCEKEIPHKSFQYDESFKTVYFFPSSVLRNNMFNVAKFKYPASTLILELNETNNAVRLISRDELNKLEDAADDNLVTISQYYFRDNRIFELYILLQYLLLKKQIGCTYCDRKQAEDNFLIKINTINNGNWRNAFITLSSLGLIDNNNLPTEAGKKMAILEYSEFAVQMYHSYLAPYFYEVYDCFAEKDKLIANNPKMANIIREKYHNRDVLFLTQSNGRYISSWMNIMRDDYGAIRFQSRQSERVINYYPTQLNDKAFEEQIQKHSIAYEYIQIYQKLIQKGVL